MSKLPANLIGAAGEHFVAYQMCCLGLVVALPRGGSPTVDLLASNPDGTKSLSVQVKTADWAMRTRGRGKAKAPHHLEFALGHKAATVNSENLFFAFVDLQSAAGLTMQPDVYIIPSVWISNFCSTWINDVSWVRFHPELKSVEEFKNNYSPLLNALSFEDVEGSTADSPVSRS